MGRFGRLGLQRRIMLYVTVGLAAMFGVGALVGSAAIDQATALVYSERLATAYTTAGIVERDLARLSADAQAAAESALRADAEPSAAAERILEGLRLPGRYPFFSIAGVCLAGGDGLAAAEVGRALATSSLGGRCSSTAPSDTTPEIVEAGWQTSGITPFADVLVPRVSQAAGSELVVIHLAAVNEPGPFDPASYGGSGRDPTTGGTNATGGTYNLEIIDPQGTTRLGIGEHEHAGQPSPHYPSIADAMRDRRAVAMVDDGDPAIGLEPHVMAVVPLVDTPYSLLLEQPTDIALALPNELRFRLVVLVILGFLATATVAWFTTRRVVQPTERLVAAAERIAGGDLTSPIEVSAQDEVAVLAEALEAMRLHLRTAREELERTNRELERRVSERTARLGQVLRKVISAQEDERHALARELHDETAQTLAAISIALDRARDEMDSGSETALGQIRAAKEIASRLLDDTRRLILGLRPSVLDDMGLGAAISWFADSTLTPLGVEVDLDLQPGQRLPSHLETSLFRVAQEAVNNVAKHAGASRARIELRSGEGWTTMVVEDDGRGFAVDDALARAPGAGSVGLAGMQERVALLGGRIAIESRRGRGTRVEVTVPTGIGEVV